MRDKERLDDFYDRLKKVHKERFQDLRFGQFIICILNNIATERDPFMLEEEEMISFIEDWRRGEK